MAPAETATSQGACCTSATVDPRHWCFLGIGTPTGPTTRSASSAAGTSCRCAAPVPEGTVRGGPVAARDTPVEIQRWRSAPGFRRRYYLASSTGGVETVLDLDEQGQQIALPLVA